ncbi:MAG: TolC family protein [Bergeyella sp.]|nr:TolC family protein [Bergeyella sp.]
MKNKICLILFWVIFSDVFTAQEKHIMSLEEAIRYALTYKADALKAGLNIEKSAIQIKEVRANVYPRIEVVGNTTYNPLLQKTLLPGEVMGKPGITVPVTFGQKWTSNMSARLTQVIFNQSVFVGLKAAKSSREFYLLNKELTDQQIIEKVSITYYKVYKSKQMLENLYSNLEISQKSMNIVKGLYDAGLAKRIDYDRSLVGFNNLKATERQLINARDINENTLKFIMGMPINTKIDLPDDTFSSSILPVVQDSISQHNRTELRVLAKQIELLEWQKKSSEAEYYPTLSFTANYGWYGQGRNIPLWNGSSNAVSWSSFAAVGLNLNIPIFTGFATKSKVEKSAIEIELAKAELKDTKLALDLEYENSLSSLQNSLITITNQEKNLMLAQKVLEDTQNNYRYGLATLNDILIAEKDLAAAKNDLTEARLDYKIAEIEYLKSQGKIDQIK